MSTKMLYKQPQSYTHTHTFPTFRTIFGFVKKNHHQTSIFFIISRPVQLVLSYLRFHSFTVLLKENRQKNYGCGSASLYIPSLSPRRLSYCPEGIDSKFLLNICVTFQKTVLLHRRHQERLKISSLDPSECVHRQPFFFFDSWQAQEVYAFCKEEIISGPTQPSIQWLPETFMLAIMWHEADY